MNLIWVNNFFVLDCLLFQPLDEICGLIEGYIAVVVAMDQEYG